MDCKVKFAVKNNVPGRGQAQRTRAKCPEVDWWPAVDGHQGNGWVHFSRFALKGTLWRLHKWIFHATKKSDKRRGERINNRENWRNKLFLKTQILTTNLESLIYYSWILLFPRWNWPYLADTQSLITFALKSINFLRLHRFLPSQPTGFRRG